jgi:hypothetical protein
MQLMESRAMDGQGPKTDTVIEMTFPVVEVKCELFERLLESGVVGMACQAYADAAREGGDAYDAFCRTLEVAGFDVWPDESGESAVTPVEGQAGDVA